MMRNGLIVFVFLANPTWTFAFDLFGTQAATSTRLCAIRLQTGEVLSCTPTIAELGPRDLASVPLMDSRIWAVARDFQGDDHDLLLGIDPISSQVVSQTHLQATGAVETLAIDPTDGRFYATIEDRLVQFDPVSGVESLIGSTGIAIDKALAFDMSGSLFGIANRRQLVHIDKTSGVTKTIGELTDVIRIEDIAFHPSSNDLYGIGYDGTYRLYQIDAVAGTTTTVGSSLFRPSGLAFATVPEPTNTLPLYLLVVIPAVVARWQNQRMNASRKCRAGSLRSSTSTPGRVILVVLSLHHRHSENRCFYGQCRTLPSC